MRTAIWPRAVALIWLVVGVAACGTTSGTSAPPVSVPSRVVPGLDPVSPLSRYQLWLTLVPAEKRLKGRSQVTVVNQTGVQLSEIVFRLYPNMPKYGGDMGVGPVWVNQKRTASTLRADDTALVIPLDHRLAPEASAVISFTFDVDIPRRSGGYGLFGQSDGLWSLPDAYPLLAVHDGSGWHEEIAPVQSDAVFASVALYDVSLTLPYSLTLATTGSVVNASLNEKGQRVYHVRGGPLREFAWLAGADYHLVETMVSGVTVRSFYVTGDETGGQAALTVAAAALRTYSDAFGPYPFAEMTVAEAPLLHYGMEYPGLNLIGQALYRDQRQELEIRVAHEIAHQWWYSQVGNDQVNTPWLDEGLAEFSTATYYEQVYGQARANAILNQRWLIPYQALVSDGLDAAVNQPAAAFGAEYEVIVYAKAALFFDALRQELGAGPYQTVMREYLDRFRWRIAKPDDLVHLVEEVSGKEIDELYSRWILGQQ